MQVVYEDNHIIAVNKKISDIVQADKTGDTPLSRARADELRLKTRASPNTPVFELNIVRGISRKSIYLQRKHLP